MAVVLLVEETGVHHQLAAGPWQTLSHNVVSRTVELTDAPGIQVHYYGCVGKSLSITGTPVNRNLMYNSNKSSVSLL